MKELSTKLLFIAMAVCILLLLWGNLEAQVEIEKLQMEAIAEQQINDEFHRTHFELLEENKQLKSQLKR